jgi:hypothetical protein
METWNKNDGTKPFGLVDIELNCDVDEWPGIPDVRYAQDPNDWDWRIHMGGVEISRWRPTQACLR